MKRTNNPETIEGLGERVVRDIVILSNNVAHGSIMLQGMKEEVVTSTWQKAADKKRTWQLVDDLRQASEEDEVVEEEGLRNQAMYAPINPNAEPMTLEKASEWMNDQKNEVTALPDSEAWIR